MSQAALLSLMKDKGFKLTVQRRQIIEALQQSGVRASAREVHARLKKINPAVSLDTVYRNLRMLTEIGLTHQISLPSGAVFELVDEGHHHHIVCVDCEKVVCIPYCPEVRTYGEHAASAGFSILGHSFEIYGRCGGCQKKTDRC